MISQEIDECGDEFLLLYCPCSSFDEAKLIARNLVEKKLIACANIIDNITSVYFWEGELQDDKEVLLLAKSLALNKKIITEEILKMHSYELPAIVFYRLDSANREYLNWIKQESGR